ncbi:MAG TPA: Rieske 2Fe-2S domain-containing protein [Terriglobales bacterium]|nr:Rieske 2Fe-2S domain-containing protein [Terriglobales bacterium]
MASEVVVCRAEELAPGQTRKFLLQVCGREEECFALNYRGRLYAYVNRCCHVPMSLDWVDNQFFTEDKRYLLCATHGACYVPDTGECIDGPPVGKFLTAVAVTIEGDQVIARATPPPV